MKPWTPGIVNLRTSGGLFPVRGFGFTYKDITLYAHRDPYTKDAFVWMVTDPISGLSFAREKVNAPTLVGVVKLAQAFIDEFGVQEVMNVMSNAYKVISRESVGTIIEDDDIPF